MPKKNSPGCTCCGGGACEFLSDDFNRANSTNMGANWTEDAGDWAVDSNEAEITTTSAVLASTATNVDGGTSKIQVRVKASNITTLARIMVAYTDSNNYLFAELMFLGGSSTLALYERSAGVDTLLAKYGGTFGVISLSTATQYLWTLCYNGETLSTVVGASTYCLTAAVSGYTGNKVALGTGSTVVGTVNFDDVTATRVADGCATCTQCGNCSTCCDEGGPFEFVLDFTGLSGVDNECSNCSSLPTEYTVQTTFVFGACYYRFYDGAFCDWPCGQADPDHCGQTYELIVELEISALCKPTVTFTLQGLDASGECLCVNDLAQATYEGSSGDMTGACEGPVTLSLTSSTSQASAACDVTFPATITLNAA